MLETINHYIIIIFVLLPTIVLHELAHGYVAYWMGDNTAKNMGRLSFNPIDHIDPLGAISLILFKFGWAKPVPINSYNFRKRHLGMFLVSIAGVTVNLILGLIFSFLYVRFSNVNPVVSEILSLFIVYNVYFAVFNLIPVPPLDGSKVVTAFFPGKFLDFMAKYEKYTYFILLILIFSGVLGKVLTPITSFIIDKFLRLAIALWV